MTELLDTPVPPDAVVVGYDRTNASDAALDWAADHADVHGRPLVVLHATGSLGTTGTTWLDSADPATSRPVREMAERGRRVLATAHDRVVRRHPDLPLAPVVRLDDPVPALLELAADAHSLVVGSHALTLTGHHVGPRLARRSPSPVVVVPRTHPGAVRRGVLAGVTADRDAEDVLDYAFAEAAVRGLPLTVLHATSDGLGATDEEERMWLAEALAGRAERYPDVHLTRYVRPGRPLPQLLALAEQMHLLVVGRHRRTGLLDLPFGHVRSGATEKATCPVAVVPPRVVHPVSG